MSAERRISPTAVVVRPGAILAWNELSRALTSVTAYGEPVPCQAAPDLFLSDAAAERRAAASRCSPCPVTDACRRFADANLEPFGVWGGDDRNLRSLAVQTTRKTHLADIA